MAYLQQDTIFAKHEKRLDTIFAKQEKRLDTIFAKQEKRLDTIFAKQEKRIISDARRKESFANKMLTFPELLYGIPSRLYTYNNKGGNFAWSIQPSCFVETGPKNDQHTMRNLSDARREESGANQISTLAEQTYGLSSLNYIPQIIRRTFAWPIQRLSWFVGIGPKKDQQEMQNMSDARGEGSGANLISTLAEQTYGIFAWLFQRLSCLVGTGPKNDQQSTQKMPDARGQESGAKMTSTFAEQTNDISSRNYSLKNKRSIIALCSQFLPCAGGIDLEDNRHKEQADSDIYQHTLSTVSHCPSVSEYMQRATDKCAEVCTNIKDGSCSYHCMRDSYKTSLVEFCAKPKLLFDYCPEYDPIGRTIQKDFYTKCKPSDPLLVIYRSSDLFLCDTGSCLQLRETGVQTGLTNLMTDATPDSGVIHETWLSQYWYIVLMLGVVLISCIVLGCIFRLRRRLNFFRQYTKRENRNDEHNEIELPVLHNAAQE